MTSGNTEMYVAGNLFRRKGNSNTSAVDAVSDSTPKKLSERITFGRMQENKNPDSNISKWGELLLRTHLLVLFSGTIGVLIETYDAAQQGAPPDAPKARAGELCR